jgi:short-subunit dehydrogenase
MAVIVLTGATRGIGRAAAIELAGCGAQIAFVGREDERVEPGAREAQTTGGGAAVHMHVGDLMLIADLRALAKELRERHERVDVLGQ